MRFKYIFILIVSLITTETITLVSRPLEAYNSSEFTKKTAQTHIIVGDDNLPTQVPPDEGIPSRRECGGTRLT